MNRLKTLFTVSAFLFLLSPLFSRQVIASPGLNPETAVEEKDTTPAHPKAGKAVKARASVKAKRTRQHKADTLSLTADTAVTPSEEPVFLPEPLPELKEQNFFDDTLLNVSDYFDAAICHDSLYYLTVDSTFISPLDSAFLEWMAGGLKLLQGEKTTLENDPSNPSDQVYLQRIQALPNIIPPTYNRIVRRFIETYTRQRRAQVSRMLALSAYYFPMIEQVIEEKGLPQELKYLPIVESALNPVATSRMGAAGLWQFMYSTGKIHGLQINSITDERRDPVKSTYAALDYLKSLHDLFGDWNLAIAAYNCGPGNVRKAIARSGGKRNFWDIYYHLPRETRSYVPFFIAANYVMTYHEDHGIYPAKLEFPFLCDTLQVHQAMHFQQISSLCKVPVEELSLLNPHFRNKIAYGTADKPGTLYLPAQYTGAFIHFSDSIPRYKAQELLVRDLNKLPPGYTTGSGDSFVYRVRSGDNLSTIARRHHVTVAQLKRWNGLRSDFLRVGQRLVIYR